MKLLLTSAGFTNMVIINALVSLVEKPLDELTLAFIPTAANVEEDDKGWLIDDLMNIKKLGLQTIDIVDISALPPEIVQKRLMAANVLVFGGGNTFHLMHWIEKSGLKESLSELIKTRIYVGISAGSMVATKSLVLSDSKMLYSEHTGGVDSMEGLGFVNFHIRPHLNSSFFPNVTVEKVAEIAQTVQDTVYAIDDDTAIKVVDGDIEVISEGKWKKYERREADGKGF